MNCAGLLAQEGAVRVWKFKPQVLNFWNSRRLFEKEDFETEPRRRLVEIFEHGMLLPFIRC